VLRACRSEYNLLPSRVSPLLQAFASPDHRPQRDLAPQALAKGTPERLRDELRALLGADRVLDETGLFETVRAAIADCSLVLATTARAHDQAKPVIGPDAAAALLAL